MGQTLTHGVYLPDEGERNCYDGLASNWSILDGAVGTVAEHTSALSGKAPLVHTHTKSDITDFPAYGNAAGTICEGNDSRLSDARTPVAHTHTKSDVTDLLNSDFIPSANNSYNLGSSSYQWNNLYAKSYFYNGTAWGLDKANTWSGINTFTAVSYGNKIALKNTGLDLSNGNSELTDTYSHVIRWVDNSNTIYALLQGWARSSDSTISISNRYKTDANTTVIAEVRLENSGTAKSFYSNSNGDTDLGTSSKKWKTLNGINPGALSLPATATTDASGDIVPPSGESSINLFGSPNTYTPSNNGWLTLAINNASGNCIIVRQNTSNRETLNYMQGYVPGQTNIYITIPVLAGVTYYIFLYANSFVMARFALCQGNV